MKMVVSMGATKRTFYRLAAKLCIASLVLLGLIGIIFGFDDFSK